MADDDKPLPETSDAESAEEEAGDRDSRSEPEYESGSETGSESSSDAEFECTVCDKRFSGYLPYKQHQRGKKHARAVARKRKEARDAEEGDDDDDPEFCLPEPFAACEVCRKEFSGPESYRAHLRSKTHRQKVAEASVLRQVREGGAIDVTKLREKLNESKVTGEPLNRAATFLSDDRQQETTEFECVACEKVFSGLTPYAQHLVSKVHARRMEGKRKVEEIAGGGAICLEEDDVLVCKACTMSFSGPESAALHLKSKNHAKQLERYVRKLEKKREKEALKKSADEKASDRDVPQSNTALPSTDNEAGKTSKEPQKALAKDVQHVNTALPSTGGEAEKTSEELEKALDEDVPKNASVLKKMASSDDEVDHYQKYKEYKKLMNSLQENDSGV